MSDSSIQSSLRDAIRSSASKQIEEGALRQKLQEYNTKITMHNYQLDEKINICKKYSQDIFAIYERQNDWAKNATVISDAISRAGLIMTTDMQKKLSSLSLQNENIEKIRTQELEIIPFREDVEKLEQELDATRDQQQAQDLKVELLTTSKVETTLKISELSEICASIDKSIIDGTNITLEYEETFKSYVIQQQELKKQHVAQLLKNDQLEKRKQTLELEMEIEKRQLERHHSEINKHLIRIGHGELIDQDIVLGKAVEIGSRVVSHQQKEVTAAELQTTTAQENLRNSTQLLTKLLEDEVEFTKKNHMYQINITTLNQELSELNISHSKVVQLQLELTSLTAEQNTAQSKLDDLQKNLGILKQKAMEIRVDVYSLNTTIKGLYSQLKNLQSIYKSFETRCNDLITEYNSKIEKMQVDQVAVQRKNEDDEIQIGNLLSESDLAEYELKQLDEERARIDASLTQEIDRQKYMIQHLELENQRLQEDIYDQQAHISNLSSKFQQQCKDDVELQVVYREKQNEYLMKEKDLKQKCEAFQHLLSNFDISVLQMKPNSQSKHILQNMMATLDVAIAKAIEFEEKTQLQRSVM